MKLIYIGEVNYKQIKNLINNFYFVYKKDWKFIDYDDMDNYNLPSQKYWLEEDINNIKNTSKRHLVIKCKNFENFGISEKELIQYIKRAMDFKLIFIDIDTINDEKRVATQPGGNLFTINGFQEFILNNESINFIGGHNIINYDVPILLSYSFYYKKVNFTKNFQNALRKKNFIDTLYLSILFSKKSSLSLDKEYKCEEKQNNPLKDAKESLQLFVELCETFKTLPKELKHTLFYFLKDNEYYKGFFKYTGLDLVKIDEKVVFEIINNYFENIDKEYILRNSFEIAIILMSKYLKKPVPPFAYKNIENLYKVEKKLVLKKIKSLKNYVQNLLECNEFEFRKFKPLEKNIFENREISQEDIINTALNNKNILAILPTGGGKSLCYQIPAVFEAENFQRFTLVISPLRSLMKDQIEGFNQKYNTSVKAGALSGFLSPSERKKLIEDVENGIVNLLYIAPESLRFKTIRSILKKRDLARVVIDEAHCISMWGHDFRPDYRYIADFLKEIYNEEIPPVSLFSATASKEVIKDIKDYFYDKLNIRFEEFIADNKRNNLIYKVIKINAENKKDIFEEKYKELLKLVKPKQIIYIPNSIKDCDEVAQRLNTESGLRVESFHSKKENREEILKNFLDNHIDIIVSTTAFGMGVDKPDIESVIHFTPSQNIEDYMQESGRAGRDEKLVPQAECISLYYEGDFDKYLHDLKSTIITRKEIQAVYQAIKNYKKDKLYITPVELAIKSKLNIDINSKKYKDKLDDIIAELVEEGLIERENNNYNIYATAIEIIDIVKVRELLDVNKKEINLAFEIYNLIKKKSRKTLDIAEAAFLLGRNEKEIIEAVKELKDKEIISEDRDIHYELNNFPMQYFKLEKFITFNIIKNQEEILKLREITDEFKIEYPEYLTANNKKLIELLEKILNIWKEDIEAKRIDKKLSIWKLKITDLEEFKNKIKRKLKYSYHLYYDLLKTSSKTIKLSKIKKIFKNLKEKEINDYLVYLHYAKAITLTDGAMIYYSQYVLKVKKQVNRYKNEMYEKRKKPYYENKRKKIHIMNEFLIRQTNSNTSEFLKNYFLMPIDDFIKKHIKFVKQYIEYFITETKYKQLFESLTDEQKEIVNSKKGQILVLAGPGSGKTKTLVNKIANLILNNEKVNPELFLMLTYTRTAMIEFKDRLYDLIGNNVYKLDIHTFHSYLYYILGENSKNINTLKDNNYIFDKFLSLKPEIKKEIIPIKSVLYLDEYQDITPKTFEIVKEIIKYSEIKEVVAVGDDDQMIMDFTGSSVRFFDDFWDLLDTKEKVSFSLNKNFRSAKNIVEYSNEFIKQIKSRKKTTDILPVKREKGIVEIIKFSSPNLFEPVVAKIMDIGIEQEIAILTHSNDTALTLKSLLNKYNIKSKLILDKQKFKWSDLFEIKEFDKAIISNLSKDDTILTDEVLNNAYQKIIYLSNSKNFYCIYALINYVKTKENFTYESWKALLDDLDDEFFNSQVSRITISTIHKSKGKEFENVIIVDENTQYNNKLNDNLMRKYYVAITRAKKGLYIYTNHDYFYNKFIENNKNKYVYKADNNTYPEPKEIILELGLGDIHLGKSFNYQEELKKVYLSNSPLFLKGNKIFSHYFIAQLSESKQNKGINKIKIKLNQGYKIKKIELVSLVYYYTENYNNHEKKEILQGIFNIVLNRVNSKGKK